MYSILCSKNVDGVSMNIEELHDLDIMNITDMNEEVWRGEDQVGEAWIDKQ